MAKKNTYLAMILSLIFPGLGLAYDGDGDRLGVVDEKGNYIATDKYMIIIIRDIINKVDTVKKNNEDNLEIVELLKDSKVIKQVWSFSEETPPQWYKLKRLLVER